MDTITSVNNTRVKAAAALQRKKDRDATDRYIVEGHRGVGEALVDGVVETLFVTAAAVDTYRTSGVEIFEVAEHVLERLTDSRTPQGVVAVARRTHPDLHAVVGRGFLIVCDRVSDPGNAGTIIRTADASGAAGVVLTPGSVDPYNPKAVRASAGSLTHLPVVVGAALADVVAACRSAEQRVVALHADAARTVDDPGALEPPVALVFGSEAHGLDADALALTDDAVSVPRHGRAESLNLAAAVAVTAYAAARAADTAGRGTGR